ncbi:hypothetical protein TUM17576_17760 [Enterobacter hormaechei]|nr:hypothetical protein TUM17576_17760 [Enterobacter hormaechei]
MLMAFKTIVAQYNHHKGISVNIDGGTPLREPKKAKNSQKKHKPDCVYFFATKTNK